MICKCLVYAAALLNVAHAAYSGIQSFGPLTAAFASQQQQQQQQQQQTVPPNDIPPGLTHLALSQLAAAQQQDPNAYHAQAAAAQFQGAAPPSFQFASAGSPGSGAAAQFQSAGGAAQYFGASFPAAQSAGSPSSGTAAQYQSAGGAAQYFGTNLPAAQSAGSPNSGIAAQYFGTSLPAAQSADTDEPEQQQQQQQQQPQRLSRPGAYFTGTAQYQPAQLKQSDTPAKAASPNLLGVAFSPASEVSQLRFSGFGANYSY